MPSIAEVLIQKWKDPDQDVWNYLDQKPKDFYKDKLRNGVWTVEFVKKNGDFTTMDVTLDPSILPEEREDHEPRPVRASHDHLVEAYSLDRQGWRSFTIANVKKFYKK